MGTPPGEDGSADLKYVLQVADEVGRNMESYKLIVTKSTVPVGTAKKVKSLIEQRLAERGKNVEFDVASNPEFLKEGDVLVVHVGMHEAAVPERINLIADENGHHGQKGQQEGKEADF